MEDVRDVIYTGVRTALIVTLLLLTIVVVTSIFFSLNTEWYVQLTHQEVDPDEKVKEVIEFIFMVLPWVYGFIAMITIVNLFKIALKNFNSGTEV